MDGVSLQRANEARTSYMKSCKPELPLYLHKSRQPQCALSETAQIGRQRPTPVVRRYINLQLVNPIYQRTALGLHLLSPCNQRCTLSHQLINKHKSHAKRFRICIRHLHGLL